MSPSIRMEKLLRSLPQRSINSNAPAAPQIEITTKLPTWLDHARGVPNVALRSALFSVSRQPVRPFLEQQVIQSQNGYEIIYTGPRLDQGDLDIWETVLHIAREQTLGGEVRVTACHMLKLLGQTDTGKNRASLQRHLSRLNATALHIQAGRYSYEGSLIDEVQRDTHTRQYIIRLNVGLQSLFASHQYTRVEWDIRQSLRGKPLAQWLHGYYASHAKPFPVTVETIHRLCGSETAALWKFTQTLRTALHHLQTACKANSQLFSHAIRGDLIYIERQPSPSQGRHLAKRAGQSKYRSNR